MYFTIFSKITCSIFSHLKQKKDQYFFSLELKAGKLICYKQVDSKKRSTWISLLKAKMMGSFFKNI